MRCSVNVQTQGLVLEQCTSALWSSPSAENRIPLLHNPQNHSFINADTLIISFAKIQINRTIGNAVPVVDSHLYWKTTKIFLLVFKPKFAETTRTGTVSNGNVAITLKHAVIYNETSIYKFIYSEKF